MSDATIDRLLLWRDPYPRSGPENMAVDEWLLETADEPTLRVYEWEGDWLSLGVFGQVQEARDRAWGSDQSGQLVRRATGGGMVDHRADRTYTLVVPGRYGLATMGWVESYRIIHEALASALGGLGMKVLLIEEESGSDSPACFERPVAWDLVDPEGKKVAGAAQRRTRRGLCHQGSIMATVNPTALFEEFAGRLGQQVKTIRHEPSVEELAAKIERYASHEWLERR